MSERKNFTPKDVYEYKSVKRLFDAIRIGSRETFASGLARFCTCLNMTPDEIIEDRKRSVREGILNNDEELKRTYEEKIVGFTEYLRGVKKVDGVPLSPNTIGSNLAAVGAFFSANYYPLQKARRPDVYNIRPLHVPTLFEMGQMLELTKDSPSKQGIIAAALQSGLGAGDITDINWSDISDTYGSIRDQLKNGIIFEGKKYDIIHVQKIRGKTHVQINTFFGKLTTSILKKTDYPQKEKVFPISVRFFERIIEDLSKQLNIPGQTTPHCIRKATTTQLKINNFNNDWVEGLTGHSLGSIRGTYFKPPVQEQLRLYLSAEKYLTPPQFMAQTFPETITPTQ